MKQLLTIIFFSLFIISSYSQDFTGGILLGVSGNQINGDTQASYKKAGLIIGAFVKKPLSKYASFKIESYYIGKGAVKNVKVSETFSYQEFNTSFHYIEMPFLYNYQLLPKFNVSIGIAPSYLFAHKLVELGFTVNKNFYTMRSFDIQPIAEVGYYLTDDITANLRVSYSILNVRKDNGVGWYNNNIGFVLAYKFK